MLIKKIREKEAHRDELMQQSQKNSKELEAVVKIKAAHQRRHEDIHLKIKRGQEKIQELQMTHCQSNQNMEERVQKAEKEHQEMKLKFDTLVSDLQSKKDFDKRLQDELNRKHQERRSPMEKRLFGLKDELATINAKVNAYESRPVKTTKANTPNPSAATRFSPAVSVQFSPGNTEGVNRFFKNRRTPTYGQKSVTFHDDAKKSGGTKRNSAALSSGASKKAKAMEPKTPRGSARTKKLFSATGYNVFDESP